MEIPRLKVDSELQLMAYSTATATATWDPSLVCDLHHSSRQCRILNALSEARDQTCILMDTSQIHFHCAAMETPKISLLKRKETLQKISPLPSAWPDCVVCPYFNQRLTNVGLWWLLWSILSNWYLKIRVLLARNKVGNGLWMSKQKGLSHTHTHTHTHHLPRWLRAYLSALPHCGVSRRFTGHMGYKSRGFCKFTSLKEWKKTEINKG